jgi:hypothetical protein
MKKQKKKVIKEDALNMTLDLAGLIPGIGEFADAANALIYASRGDYLMAGLSLISTIPALGDVVGKGGKVALWLEKNVSKNVAKNVVKYGPDVVNGIKTVKTLIIQNKPLISKLFAGLQQEAKSNPIAAKIVPHLPRVWEALNVFTQSQEVQQQMQSQPQQTVQPQMEALFLPSLVDTLFETHIIDRGISPREAQMIANRLGLDFKRERFDFKQFLKGANHEIEHRREVESSPSKIAQIALDHLKEDPMYYDKLERIE